jgi:hypothetical protein
VGLVLQQALRSRDRLHAPRCARDALSSTNLQGTIHDGAGGGLALEGARCRINQRTGRAIQMQKLSRSGARAWTCWHGAGGRVAWGLEDGAAGPESDRRRRKPLILMA